MITPSPARRPVRQRRRGTPDMVAVQATDAMLDRLGARDPSLDDLADPVTAVLAGLAREVDLDTDLGEQSRQVLAGRTSRGGQWFDHPEAVFPRPLPPRTARAAAHRRAGDAAHAAASRMARALPIAGAAAGVVLVISAGVSAAVTGNPLAPITSVVTLLSPDQSVPASVTTVRRTLDEARAAAAQGELDKARLLLLSARHSLPTVPRSAAGGLQQQISALEGQIAGSGGATAPTASATAATAMAAPTATASPTDTATATDTPPPTDQPTTTTSEPSPTEDPSASPTDTATASDNAPTAAVTTSAPSP